MATPTSRLNTYYDPYHPHIQSYSKEPHIPFTTLPKMRRGNIQVLIKSEGRILPEYQVETLDGGKTVACYIPSEVGKVHAPTGACLSSDLIFVELRDLLAR